MLVSVRSNQSRKSALHELEEQRLLELKLQPLKIQKTKPIMKNPLLKSFSLCDSANLGSPGNVFGQNHKHTSLACMNRIPLAIQ